MKKYLLFSLLLPILARSQSNIDVLHYRFEISLSDSSDNIRGTATIRFQILKETNEVSFDLTFKSGNRGMSIFSVVDSSDENKLLPVTHKGDRITIRLKETVQTGQIQTLIIRYSGIPTDGLIISKNKFNKRTFFADNWPNRAHHWLPCVDDPADKAPVDFIVTAPAHYQVISNGIQIEETNLPGDLKLTHYKEEIPLPTKIMVIGVAEFGVNLAGMIDDCIPVSSWVFADNKNEGFEDYRMARDILAWYINYIGPYPYKKLANVQSKTIFGGMENANAIFYFENSVNGLRSQETLFAHEIVHQWFGDMATEKSFAHLWLSEGFATYLTHLYIESKYGADSLYKRMLKDRDEIISFLSSNPRPVVDSTKDYMSLLNENSYQRGGWVLHMLRKQLGDSAFQKSIRTYYKTYAGKNADTKDLQAIFENVSGKKLDRFFKQWLYTAEIPSLDISWQHDPKKKEVIVKIKQLQRDVFEFPLTISVISDSGAGARYNQKIGKREQEFQLPFPGTPKDIAVLDVLTSALFKFTITRIQ